MDTLRGRIDERGVMNALLIPLVVLILLLLGTAVFAVMSFSSMQDYKNNSDEKSAAAVAEAIKQEDAKKTAEFAEQSKSPLKNYSGPAAYGGVQVAYPKTWSAYVIEQSNGSNNVDGYFNPDFVPSTSSQTSSYALRVKVIGQSYAQVMQTLQSSIKIGKMTAQPYAFPKVPDVIGTRLSGEIAANKQGTMVIVPLRANTLEVWTEGTGGKADFDTYILPNLSFSP
jgi:hypothetical protein